MSAPGAPVAPLVRVVVLNWNAAWLTARCVRSLQATEWPADRLELVVVDNASIDGSLTRLRTDLAALPNPPRFVENPANLGFAEGNNRALRDLDHVDYVALVNNDATVEPGWLAPLVEALQSDETVGGAAPKMLLESPFASIELTGDGTIARITVDGADVTRRCLSTDLRTRPDDEVPLALVRSVAGRATVHVPVGPAATDVVVEWAGDRAPDVHRVPSAGDDPSARTVRINSLGTELTPWTEGTERWFGEADRPHLAVHDVWGFSGGGVLLRPKMLREVGVFDPRFFAYYEDTDLAWRARRRGWRFVCVPESRVVHLHGGSAGPEARGFFFLNYRNWLLTVLRNGRPADLWHAATTARRLSFGPFRRNVFGRLRRGRRPYLSVTAAWARVLAGFLGAATPTLARRWSRLPLAAAPTDDVGSRLLPATPPRAPRPRAGGPLLVYVDATETLRSGWRAGIQRVVCEVVRELPPADADLELVPICWSKVHDRFRRLDSAEYARLLAPTATQQPNRTAPPPSPARKVLATVMHRSGAAPLVHAYRRHQELAAVPEEHRALLLDRLEPGSVFLDVDASWNPTTRPRSELLPELRAGGVRTVTLLHDLIPIAHPEWFIPQLVEVFRDHVDAHLRAGSTFLCNSEHTRSEIVEHAEATGHAVAATVVPLGATLPARPVERRSTSDRPYFLTVGTVEPRKGHAVLLDAFAKVHAEHPAAGLVVVGRAGWRNDEVVDRLEARPAGVIWRTDVSDDELDELYAGALAVVVASVTEGFGLPVVEALVRGVPVISSDGGALPEAGGDIAEYVGVGEVDELRSLLERYLTDPAHVAARNDAARAYDPPTWRETAATIARELRVSAPRT